MQKNYIYSNRELSLVVLTRTVKPRAPLTADRRGDGAAAAAGVGLAAGPDAARLAVARGRAARVAARAAAGRGAPEAQAVAQGAHVAAVERRGRLRRRLPRAQRGEARREYNNPIIKIPLNIFFSVGGSFAATWARMVLKKCSSERWGREKRFYVGRRCPVPLTFCHPIDSSSDSDSSWLYQGACSGWLKEVAFSNIDPIYLTLDTFQLLSGWLKELASTNIPYIFVTFAQKKSRRSWLPPRLSQVRAIQMPRI